MEINAKYLSVAHKLLTNFAVPVFMTTNFSWSLVENVLLFKRFKLLSLHETFSLKMFLRSNTTQNVKTVVKISFFKVLTLTLATKGVYIREEF